MLVFKHALKHAHAIELENVVDHWFWDGRPEAMAVFAEQLPNARGHLCLEHAKRNAKDNFKGGWKKLVPNHLEMLAFTTPFMFSVAVDRFLETLTADNQNASYLTTTRQGGGFHADAGIWGCTMEIKFH